MTDGFELIEHTADLAIRVTGRDLPDLFANAASALFHLMAAPPDTAERIREVNVESIDLEGLLVDWLNELIFLHEVHGESFISFDILAFTPTCLRAMIWGGPTRQKLKTIKAATFHNLEVLETDAGAQATIVFDV